MTFNEYVSKFMPGIFEYYQSLIKLRSWNLESASITKMLSKLKEEYKCDHNFDKTTVEEFLSDDHIRFQMTISYNLAKEFYNDNYVMRFIEFIDFRDMAENTLIDQKSDISVYTRIVQNLKIPTDQIPSEYIQLMFTSDEFMFATNYILKVIHENMNDPTNYSSVDEYRSHVEKFAEHAISKLNEMNYYGTYEKNYLIELMVAYRVGYNSIGPLYITSKFLKNPNKYEDIKAYVDRLWEQFKQNG